MAAKEVSGVIVAAMFWQQGPMQEVAVWEIEVGDALRGMVQMVLEAD